MEKLFEMIVRMTPVLEKLHGGMFFIKDDQGRYVYLSPSFLNFFGKPSSHFLYKKAEDVWGKSSSQINLLLEDEKSLLCGELTMSDRNLRMLNSLNEEKFLRVFKTSLFDENEKKVIGIIGIAVDISSDRSMLFYLLHLTFRRLSKSEKRYFFFRSEGRSRTEISREMNTTIETIDSYRYRIMKKFKVNDDEMMFLEKIYKIFIDENFNMQQKF